MSEILNEQTVEVVIDGVSIGNAKQSKNGKEYYSPGIKVQGDPDWRNCFAWPNAIDDIKALKKGDKVKIITFEEEYQGKTYKKFKMPDKASVANDRFEKIEARLAALEDGAKSPAEKLVEGDNKLGGNDLEELLG